MIRTLLALLLAGFVLVAASPAPADASPAVERAQRRLNQLGCQSGPADGDMGDWTRSAVLRFQSRHRLAQTGNLNSPTTRRLYSAGRAGATYGRCQRAAAAGAGS